MTKVINWLPASACVLLLCGSAQSQSVSTSKTFSQVVDQVLERPEFRHASFGIEIYSLDRQETLFAINKDKLFTPGSTTKLLTEGAALKYLGPEYRFHTCVYRTGEMDKDGTLKGDLVLVASGDPNLSNRLQPDGSLAFQDEDHSYGGPESKLVPGDPATVINEFAHQIATAGIRKVQGKVNVDVSMFPEGARELGTGVVISPIVVNDNVIDLTISPQASVGAPADMSLSLQVPYIQFKNKVTTGVSASTASIHVSVTTDGPSGTQTVTLSGSVPQGGSPYIHGYAVPSPSRFAAALLTQALQASGVVFDATSAEPAPDPAAAKAFYAPQYKVAEHISAPLAEEVKVTLKVSQNLHASMTPFIVGAVAGKATERIDQKGLSLEHDWLTQAGLDLTGASQSDGAGGAEAAFYSPDFMVHYLAYIAQQPAFPAFKKALPILGRDGTLAEIQADSRAAGHVFAKTGTFDAYDLLNMQSMLVGKGLAGYTETPSGEHVAFAIYLNHVALPNVPNAIQLVGGQALGEIAAAIYLLPIDKPTLEQH